MPSVHPLNTLPSAPQITKRSCRSHTIQIVKRSRSLLRLTFSKLPPPPSQYHSQPSLTHLPGNRADGVPGHRTGLDQRPSRHHGHLLHRLDERQPPDVYSGLVLDIAHFRGGPALEQAALLRLDVGDVEVRDDGPGGGAGLADLEPGEADGG